MPFALAGLPQEKPRSGPHSRTGDGVWTPRGFYRDILHKVDWQVLGGSSSLWPPDCPTDPKQSSAGAGAEKKEPPTPQPHFGMQVAK